jgi:hypothetical protein
MTDTNPPPVPRAWGRPKPEQTTSFTDGLDRTTFDGAQFPAYLNVQSMRFQRNGSLAVTFMVPAAHVDEAFALRHLLKSPYPLSVDVQILRRAAEALADDERKIRLLSAPDD